MTEGIYEERKSFILFCCRESFEAQINDYANQIDNLSQERAQLLDEIRNNASSSSVQSNDNDKLVKVNTKLKRVLQTFKEKINRLVSDRPELFANTGEETSERFDRLISTVEEQANQINILQNEIEALREYRQEQIQEMPLAQSSNDWDDQQSPVQLETIKTKLQQITTDYPEYFSNTTDNLLDNLDQFVVIIKNLQNSEKQQTNLQRYFDLNHYLLHIEFVISVVSSKTIVQNLLKPHRQRMYQHHRNNVYLVVSSNKKCSLGQKKANN